jgi:predicted DNA-binding transcriptional regulator AlpA
MSRSSRHEVVAFPASNDSKALALPPVNLGTAGLLPLLIDSAGVGRLVGLSNRTIRRMDSAAQLPRSVACGSSKRWLVEEIRAWVAAGCPDRARWEVMNKQS